ncbi:Rne/Rng family ribonuclease [Priestia flexa]|uniref:Rne/Rng family ribonuclease n=1 Tax=Priestia flexa TaxID=86664 RepID=UPI003FD2A4A8
MRKCIINAATKSKRIAVINDGELEEIYLEEQNKHQIVGDIYIGRVVRVVPGMQAAFVDIGLSQNGFIHQQELVSYRNDSDTQRDSKPMSAFIREGEAIVVQVIKEGIGTKGPRLTGVIEFATEELVYLPDGNYVATSKKMEEKERVKWKQLGQQLVEEKEGLVFRTAVQSLTEEQVIKRVKELRVQYQHEIVANKNQKAPKLLKKGQEFLNAFVQNASKKSIQEFVVDDFTEYQQLLKAYPTLPFYYYKGTESVFEHYEIESQLEKLLKRIVWLKSGGYIVIDETEAMTVVDVNTGKFSGKSSLRENILRVNKEAAFEMAKQLKLRHIGGMVLIDFINMSSRQDRDEVLKYVQDIVKEDEVRTTVVGFTELGILQLTRKKVRDSIGFTLTTACQVCNGTGRVMDAEAIAFQIERKLWEYRFSTEEAIWVETREDVEEYLKNDGFFHAIEEMIGLKLYCTPTLSASHMYHVKYVGKESVIRDRLRK